MALREVRFIREPSQTTIIMALTGVGDDGWRQLVTTETDLAVFAAAIATTETQAVSWVDRTAPHGSRDYVGGTIPKHNEGDFRILINGDGSYDVYVVNDGWRFKKYANTFTLSDIIGTEVDLANTWPDRQSPPGTRGLPISNYE
jgi:hypothetical protein